MRKGSLMPSLPDLYMGVDIESGSPEAIAKARYSVVVVDQDLRLVAKAQGISLAGVIRLSWERRPKAIAVDNVFELAPGASTEGLSKFLSLLPPGTGLVQVTATENGFIDIREAARRAGIDVGSQKPSPTRTAFLAAAIAARGRGQRVGFTREKTLIYVTKGHAGSGGGWSQGRYQRRVRASVRLAAERIRERLDRANIDYDVYYRSGEGGIESATFIVYAPRDRLVGLVRPHKGIDYVVRVETKYEGELIFGDKEGTLTLRPVIVGIDAGMTAGLAAIDVEGRVLHLGSYKEVDRGVIISVVSKLGKPILVATDVKDPPELVRKLAAQLGAQLFTPSYDLAVVEKEGLSARVTEGSELKPKTPHERDALAAAFKAYLEFKSKLSQVESYVSTINIDIDVNQVKADIIRGVTLAEAIEKQIERLIGSGSQSRTSPQQEKRERPKECDESKAELLEAQKIALEREVQELRARLDEAERRLESMRKELKLELMRDAEIVKLKSDAEKAKALLSEVQERAKALEEKVDALRRAILLLRGGGFVLARKLQELKVQDIRRSEAQMGELMPGELIVIERWSSFESEAVERVAKAQAAALMPETNVPLADALRSKGVPVLPLSGYNVIEIDDLALVDAGAARDAYNEARGLRAKLHDELLQRLIDEYRHSRASPGSQQRPSRRRG
ncbi:MAG: DUF460 domain-containing protein [Acidilobus sp.]